MDPQKNNPVTEDIKTNAEKVKEHLKHVETQEKQYMPTQADIEAEKKAEEAEKSSN
ncbi:4095_t:CDS:2 [Paraglomus brasilianum]|uniref:4095_t:CDS:1 n=1 Tax=Paraglomus brasilianum TaxID=144538 RepID=A0A9N9GC91_9GLOM|nr:4095_t:CDS:2 [Paraglomus brasilianum]